MIEELKEIPTRFNPIDVGMPHLGGTRLPAGGRLPFGLTVTMDGRQGAELVAMLALPKAIPVHVDDYAVFASPLADFTREMQHRGLGGPDHHAGPPRLGDRLKNGRCRASAPGQHVKSLSALGIGCPNTCRSNWEVPGRR